MNELPDDEIRARFDALRAAEQRGAPSFHAVLDRAASSPPKSLVMRWRASVLFALAAAAAVLFTVSVTRRSSDPRVFTARPLAAWTSPTASLLQTPGSDLLIWPTLAPSVLDGVTSGLTSMHDSRQDKRP